MSWQAPKLMPVVAKKDYTLMTVSLVYDHNVNTVYFDGIQLYKEEFGNSYTYNSDGNVVSVVDLQKQETTYEYDTNNNLTKISQNNKAKMTYEYDNYHNVIKATTDEDVVYSFEYDRYGNNTKVTIGSGSNAISSRSQYTNDGNYMVNSWDALGKQTWYSYNETKGVLNWVRYPEDTAPNSAHWFPGHSHTL